MTVRTAAEDDHWRTAAAIYGYCSRTAVEEILRVLVEDSSGRSTDTVGERSEDTLEGRSGYCRRTMHCTVSLLQSPCLQEAYPPTERAEQPAADGLLLLQTCCSHNSCCLPPHRTAAVVCAAAVQMYNCDLGLLLHKAAALCLLAIHCCLLKVLPVPFSRSTALLSPPLAQAVYN